MQEMANTLTMAAPSTVRVLLIDDHELFRAGLAELLGTHDDINVVASVASVSEAVGVLQISDVDLVLLDLRLAAGHGLSLMQAMDAAGLDRPKVLVVSADDKVRTVQAAMSAGADGYLCKGISARELVEGVRRAAAGHPVVATSLLGALVRAVTAPVQALAPTTREQEVLEFLAEGLTSPAIARGLEISVRTVQKHIEHLFQKFDVGDRVMLVRKALDAGLVGI